MFTLAFALFAAAVFPQVTEQRVIQAVIINGAQAQGVMVIENGAVRSYTCSSPQSYVTVNRSESGWACFDQASGTWLLHALPPASQQQPVIIYSQPSPAVVVSPYYSYAYPYSYSYPYAYTYSIGPRFGFPIIYRSPRIITRPIVIGNFGHGRPIGNFVIRSGRVGGHIGGRFGRR